MTGLAQNEMKAKPALPERVRSMEGLGVTEVSAHIVHRTSRNGVAVAQWQGCEIRLEGRIWRIAGRLAYEGRAVPGAIGQRLAGW